MKLFKYKSIEGDNFEYTLDILKNKRLYCAPYVKLNDPFEGIFFYLYGGNGIIKPIIQPIVRPLVGSLMGGGRSKAMSVIDLLDRKFKICSLSSKLDDVRLWAYYGGNQSGIAIEINFETVISDVYEVDYISSLPTFDQNKIKEIDVKQILSFKTTHWDYEEEWRIIQDNEYYSIEARITAVYLGVRVDTTSIRYKELIKYIPSTVPIYQTKLNFHKMSIEVVRESQKI